MTNLSNPEATVNILGAPAAVPNTAQKILLLGQQTSAGTATDGELVTGLTKATALTLGGSGGMMYDAVEDIIDINDENPIDAIFLDDPTGAAAVGTILWDGTATEAGTLEVGCAHYGKGVASVAVTSGMTDAQLAAAVTAAFTALDTFTVTVSTNATPEQNDFTYNHDGTEGNTTPLWVKGTVAGITYTLTGFTGGTGVPTMTSVLDAVGDARYQTIIAPGSYGVAYLATHLDGNFNVDNDVRDGVAVVSVSDSYANHVTALGSINSKSIAYRCESSESKSWFKGTGQYISDFAASAQIGAIRALRRSDGSNITQYVNASAGPKDATGGPAISSLPYYNTPLNWTVTESGFGFTSAQVKALKNTSGGFVVGNNSANTAVVIGQIPTTYKTDASGAADLAFKYLNYVDTYSSVREYIFNNIKSDCDGRLTEGGVTGGRNMDNEGTIRSKFLRYCKVLSEEEYVLVESGEAAYQFIEKNLNVAIAKSSGTASVTARVPIVTQTRTIIVNIAFTFSVDS